jgi:hypothetical protein
MMENKMTNQSNLNTNTNTNKIEETSKETLEVTMNKNGEVLIKLDLNEYLNIVKIQSKICKASYNGSLYNNNETKANYYMNKMQYYEVLYNEGLIFKMTNKIK